MGKVPDERDSQNMRDMVGTNHSDRGVMFAQGNVSVFCPARPLGFTVS